MYETNAVGVAPLPQSAPVRTPEVQSTIEQLGLNIDMLDKTLTELEARISSVLAQHQTSESEKNVPEPVRVPLADILNTRARHVATLTTRVRSMLERIEL